MDLILVILSAYFLGKKVAEKGYSSFQWRIRHVCACIFADVLTGLISLSINGDWVIANLSGMLSLIAIILFRYQRLQKLEPVEK